MIDLHTHVLPGIDDGPDDLAAALDLVRAAADAGVSTLAATPHVRPDHPRVRPAELADRVAALNSALKDAAVGATVVVGGEVDVFWAREASPEELGMVSFGQRGSDLLVETPYGLVPPVFEDLLFHLTGQGFRLLLAHPERSPTPRRHPERLAALVERGTLLQLTASALAGSPRRSRSARFALDLVRDGLAHVIASDVHGESAARGSLPEGVEGAARVDRARAEWMVTDAPAAILAGEPLPAPPAARRTARGARLLRALRRR